MINELVSATLILAAFFVAGILQTVWLKSKLFKLLNWPLDCGIRLRGREVFGQNKTISGFLGMIAFTTLSFLLLGLSIDQFTFNQDLLTANLSSPSDWAQLGAWLGFGYMLGELPNSFVKRRFNILPGQLPLIQGWKRVVIFFDQMDSLIFAIFTCSLLLPVGWFFIVTIFVFGFAMHLGFNFLLFYLGMKERPN